MALAQIFGTFTLGSHPELRQTPQGTPVLDIRAAANKNKRLPDGSFETKATHWANLNFWNTAASEVAATATKGDRIEIVGEVETQEWEDKNDGSKRSKDLVRVKFFKVWKKDSDQQGQSIAGAMQQQGGYPQQNFQQQPQNFPGGFQQQGGYPQQGQDPWGGGQQQFGIGDDTPPF